MKVITTIKEMQQIALDYKKSDKSIGFVPTMGFLHEGHLTLMEASIKENDITIASVFVNPKQFGPNEDFNRYPRDPERDEELAKSVGVDYFFYPHVDEMYPGEMNTTLLATKRTDVLCGQVRPGHFDGVVVVLAKLFNITLPEAVYMGLKDAQQVAVVAGLIEDYNIPTQLIPVPTVREADGLAKSSRNVYLSDAERVLAPSLYAALQHAEHLITSGENQKDRVASKVLKFLEDKKLNVDYVEIYSYPELTPIEVLNGKIIIAVAVKFEKARLIDNMIIEVEK